MPSTEAAFSNPKVGTLSHIADRVLLSLDQLEKVCAVLPLISIDWVVINPDRQLLLCLRSNASARGWWFTLGGQIRKSEPFQQAMARITLDELWSTTDLLRGAVLIDTWDHFYPDSAFSPAVATHYVNLLHWLPLSWQRINGLAVAGWGSSRDR